MLQFFRIHDSVKIYSQKMNFVINSSPKFQWKKKTFFFLHFFSVLQIMGHGKEHTVNRKAWISIIQHKSNETNNKIESSIHRPIYLLSNENLFLLSCGEHKTQKNFNRIVQKPTHELPSFYTRIDDIATCSAEYDTIELLSCTWNVFSSERRCERRNELRCGVKLATSLDGIWINRRNEHKYRLITFCQFNKLNDCNLANRFYSWENNFWRQWTM